MILQPSLERRKYQLVVYSWSCQYPGMRKDLGEGSEQLDVKFDVRKQERIPSFNLGPVGGRDRSTAHHGDIMDGDKGSSQGGP